MSDFEIIMIILSILNLIIMAVNVTVTVLRRNKKQPIRSGKLFGYLLVNK